MDEDRRFNFNTETKSTKKNRIAAQRENTVKNEKKHHYFHEVERFTTVHQDLKLLAALVLPTSREKQLLQEYVIFAGSNMGLRTPCSLSELAASSAHHTCMYNMYIVYNPVALTCQHPASKIQR